MIYITQVEYIKSQIEGLSKEELDDLYSWFAEKEWQDWDEQVEADSALGKLDFLLEEAMNAKS